TGEADQPPGAFVTSGLEHPELKVFTNQSRVDIAPHDVFYDDKRRLWYCDIEVNWGAAYWPFIRLALARYQPVSLDSAHLSNVVPSSVVEVWVERLDPALGEDFGWVREPDAFVQQGVLLPDFARERIAEAAQKKEQIRAKELVTEREFAAILDERLIDHVFVS